ncbi:MAG TPA: NnrS family protein [Polyangiaceae bacterium]
MTTARRLRAAHAAPVSTRLPLLEQGFRPFFLLGAAFAVVAVPLWLVALHGQLEPGGAFGALQWHAHEMLFGFSTAIIAGFLLTAVSNWTGRETLSGSSLGLLALLWLLARGAVFFAARLPKFVPALLDLAFLPALALACALPLVAAKNRRNYGFVALLLGLAAANAGAHWAALTGDLETVRLSHLFALNLMVVMLVAMTGRVLPLFTRNATRLSWVRAVPLLEHCSLGALLLLALADLVPRLGVLSAPLAAAGAVLLAARSWFWGTRHTARVPLLWILHAGAWFLPLGLALKAIAQIAPVVSVASALHALTAGALGSLTLGMMARVSLGHSGRALEPKSSMKWAFLSVIAAALLRIGAPLLPATHYLSALGIAAALWSAAFAIFLRDYWQILLSARADAR